MLAAVQASWWQFQCGGFKSRGKDKHVLKFPLLHVLWKPHYKDGRDLFARNSAGQCARVAVVCVGCDAIL